MFKSIQLHAPLCIDSQRLSPNEIRAREKLSDFPLSTGRESRNINKKKIRYFSISNLYFGEMGRSLHLNGKYE